MDGRYASEHGSTAREGQGSPGRTGTRNHWSTFFTEGEEDDRIE